MCFDILGVSVFLEALIFVLDVSVRQVVSCLPMDSAAVRKVDLFAIATRSGIGILGH